MEIVYEEESSPLVTTALCNIPVGQVFTGLIGEDLTGPRRAFHRTGKGVVDLHDARRTWEHPDTLIRDYLPRKAVLTLEGPTP